MNKIEGDICLLITTPYIGLEEERIVGIKKVTKKKDPRLCSVGWTISHLTILIRAGNIL